MNENCRHHRSHPTWPDVPCLRPKWISELYACAATPGLAGTFLSALVASHFVYFVSGVQVIAGALLLVNQFVPLALALLAPVLYNILAFHITMEPSGLLPGLICSALWLILVWRLRDYFVPMFVQKAVEK